MTEQEVKNFASEHAPALAARITEMCGRVIAKGLEGVIQQAVEMQLRIDALEATLKANGITLYEKDQP